MKQNIYNNLKDKIKSKSATIVVMGLGYVGLPLAVEFAKLGYKVIGYDVSEDAVSQIKQGKSYITGISDKTIKDAINKMLIPTTDAKLLHDADFIIICVPTPLQENKTPDLKYVKSAASTISQNLRSGQFIILYLALKLF